MDHPDNESILYLFKKLDAQVAHLSETLKEIIDVLQQPKQNKPVPFIKKTRPGPKPKVRGPPDFNDIELKSIYERG
ncbi:hypothetical protein GpartN1_g3510.t1 [Galdieria partita]|uniref:Uncharacterized protein n=1 Tax=Galdieria partita TaxID=83374 RepID=A0A9C7PWY3_9RHOD|nr:hypothetical protein GpartN1_g3510.t1 [Galdieria partita]